MPVDGVSVAAVREIPHPREVGPALRSAESEEWFLCGKGGRATQGWKLYVPLTPLNAAEIIERLIPILERSGLQFKYIRNLKLLSKLNAGIFGYSQIGKGFVIYLPKPRAVLIAELKRALTPYRDQSPAVPLAIPFGDELPLYYRYGSYHSRRISVAGVAIDDKRADAGQAVPAGINDLLAGHTTPTAEDPDVESFLVRYPVYQAIVQQGKCGVFRGLNLNSEVFQEVILKVGYHRGQIQPDGSDGCSLLRRESAFYRELERRGLRTLAPRLIDSLDVRRKVILVLDYIKGKSLLEHQLKGTLRIDHLNRCWTILRDLHEAGLYLGDAKLANVLITEKEEVRFIDFESAGVLGVQPPEIRTFFIDPLPDDPFAADQAHFLASVLFSYRRGRHSLTDQRVDLQVLAKRQPKTEIEMWALEKLRSVMQRTRTGKPVSRQRVRTASRRTT